MKLPKKIYLQGNKDFAEFRGFGDVTWCADKISEDDTLYIQVDEVLKALPDDKHINRVTESTVFVIGAIWMREKIIEILSDEK